MKTRFLVLRHGQAEGNVRNLFGGHTDTPLTALGRRQAMAARAALAGEQVDLAFASPMSRAYDTAVLALGDQPVKVERTDALIEIYGGKWEEIPYADLKDLYPDTYRVWMEQFGLARPDGGESVAELSARVMGFLKEIARKHPGKTVLIGTHATPVRLMQTHALGLPVERAGEVAWPTNASLSVFEVEGDEMTSIVYSRDDYMGEFRTALSKDI